MNNKRERTIQTIPTVHKSRRSWCCTIYKDKSNFKNVLEHLDLSPLQKEIIQIRYLNILENLQRRSRNYSYIYFTGHFIITVGSLFVPALLSIQNSDKSYTFSGQDFSVQMYWATFVISLLVTTFNGVLTLFKVDKKYYFLNTTLERLRSEGWQYFGLTGRYSGHLLDKQKPSHSNQFVFFTHYVEKIKMKQVAEEYFKADEKIAQTPNGNSKEPQQESASDFYPPSPDQPHSTMTQVPEPVKEAVNSIIKSRKTIESMDRHDNVIVIPETESVGSYSSSIDSEKLQDDIYKKI
jgi:hypothetical protein